MISHKNEFSRFARNYVSSNNLQQKIAKHLISLYGGKFKHILDLGCGGGEVYKNLTSFDKLIAIDSSKNMCDLHPKNQNINVICADFDDDALFASLKKSHTIDLTISSSSLQWSCDIDRLMKNISSISDNLLIAVFTDNSFSSLHKYFNIKSPIYSQNTLVNAIEARFDIRSMETIKYDIKFDSSKELLLFVKNTGISGGKKLVSTKNVLRLIKENTIKILEFEVVYVCACVII